MFSRIHHRHAFLGILLAGALLLTNSTSLRANLAVFSTSDIQRSGNLVPIRKTRIKLVNEKFTAKLEAETTRVVVDYEFVNAGSADSVTVGFPVDLMPPPGEGTSYHLNNSNDGLRDLRIIDGSIEVPIERTVEETLSPENRPKDVKDVAVTRRWSIATIGFKARERKSVRVSYVVRCMGVDEGFETYIPQKISARTFLYTFRTAAGWGSGRIRQLEIAVDASYLQENRFPILGLEPKLKDKGGGILRTVFQNADLGLVPDLVIRYDPKPALFHRYAQEQLLRRSNWQLRTCRAEKSGTDNLTDGNPQTAWTPAIANGVGACIEITPRNQSYLNAIAILNGNQTSPSSYTRHARIKKLRVEYPLRLEEGPKHEVFEQTFSDEKFDDRVSRFPTAMAQFLEPPPVRRESSKKLS